MLEILRTIGELIGEYLNKYHQLMQELEATEGGSMKCVGNSMLPILPNPSICHYRKQDEYDVGDIVFCKVRGRFIDAHKITKKQGGMYMIANNHGHENGWTRIVYGKVVYATDKHGRHCYGQECQPLVFKQ
jgi:hypothetical protein